MEHTRPHHYLPVPVSGFPLSQLGASHRHRKPRSSVYRQQVTSLWCAMRRRGKTASPSFCNFFCFHSAAVKELQAGGKRPLRLICRGGFDGAAGREGGPECLIYLRNSRDMLTLSGGLSRIIQYDTSKWITSAQPGWSVSWWVTSWTTRHILSSG